MSNNCGPVYEFDELDLALNGEIYTCPSCEGEGVICYPIYDDNGNIIDEVEEPCDNCGGAGEIGVFDCDSEEEENDDDSEEEDNGYEYI